MSLQRIPGQLQQTAIQLHTAITAKKKMRPHINPGVGGGGGGGGGGETYIADAELMDDQVAVTRIHWPLINPGDDR